MLDRLQYVKQRFDEISDLIIQPDVISDQKRYVLLNQEYKGLKNLMEKREELLTVTANINEANEIISDGSDAEMVEAWTDSLTGLSMAQLPRRRFLPSSRTRG